MLLTALPLAFAVTPGFIWAGAILASIPIIIHLLNRRRFKIIRWAAMEYLLAAMRKNRRRLKFEQILLLATRCALLAILGLALARPLGCSDNSLAALAGSRSALHVFVVDNSLSMAYEADRPNAKTHLEQAKILVKQQIEKLASGSESVAIVSAARPKLGEDGKPQSQVILRPTFDLDSARHAVDRLEQSFGGTEIAAALTAAAQLAREENKQPQKFLYIVSDNTQSAWGAVHADALKQAGQAIEEAFSKGHTRLNDLSRQGQWNLAVLDVYPDGALVTSNFHTDFLADVKGYGQGPETNIQWKWDDKVLEGGNRLQLNPASEIQRQTRISKKEGGAHILSVSLINDERLKADNVRHRVVQVASEMRVLIVEGERGTGLLSGSGAFLDLALAPQKEIGPGGRIRTDSYVAPEVISDLEFGNKVLADYKAVILANVASLSPPQADQLERFITSGGTLMTFMGEQVNADAYNSILLPRKLLPGKLVARKVSSDARGFTLDFKPNGPLHPILGIFRGEDKSGLDTAPIFTYYQVELAAESKPDVVLSYVTAEKPTNDPAITRQQVGKGFVVTITTTANGDWNNLPPKPAYIALMHELLAGSVDIGEQWMNLTVGQTVEIPAAYKFTGAPVLTDSTRKPIPVDAIQAEGGATVYRSKTIDRPGVYSLNVGSAILPIAVNPPADEADLRALPAEAIRKSLGDIELQVFGDTIPAGALSSDDGNDFGWLIMAMLLLPLVAAECFMAMRFGHYRRSSVKPVAAKTT